MRKRRYWIWGGLIAVAILVMVLFSIGLNELIKSPTGKCKFFPFSGSSTAGACFIASAIYSILWSIPAFIVGTILGFIIEKLINKKIIKRN
jgi:hypothetical protein